MFKKFNKLANRLSNEDFNLVLQSLNEINKSAEESIKTRVPLSTILSVKDNGDAQDSSAYMTTSDSQSSRLSDTEYFSHPAELLDEVLELSDERDNAGDGVVASQLSNLMNLLTVASRVPWLEMFPELNFPLDAEIVLETPLASQRQVDVTADSKFAINFYEYLKRNNFEVMCPLGPPGLLGSDTILWQFYSNKFLCYVDCKDGILDGFIINRDNNKYSVSPGTIPTCKVNRVSPVTSPIPRDLLMDSPSLVLEAALDPEVPIIQLLDGIIEILPSAKHINSLVEKFFRELFPFMPVLDESEFKSKISQLLNVDASLNRVVNIAIRSIDDLIYTGILLLILRFSYVSTLEVRLPNEESNLAFMDIDKPIVPQAFTLAEIIAIKVTASKLENHLILQLLFFVKLYKVYGPEFGYANSGVSSEKVQWNILDICEKLGYSETNTRKKNDPEYNKANIGTKMFYYLQVYEALSTANLGFSYHIQNLGINCEAPTVTSNNLDPIVEEASVFLTRWMPFFVKQISLFSQFIQQDSAATYDEFEFLNHLTEENISNRCNVFFYPEKNMEVAKHDDIIELLIKDTFVEEPDQIGQLKCNLARHLKFRNFCSLNSSKISMFFHVYLASFNLQSFGHANEAFLKILIVIYKKAFRLMDTFFTTNQFHQYSVIIIPYITIMMLKVMLITLSFLLKAKLALQLNIDEASRIHLTLFKNLLNVTIRICLKFIETSKLYTTYLSLSKYKQTFQQILEVLESNDFKIEEIDTDLQAKIMAQFGDNKFMEEVCTLIIKNIKLINLDNIILEDNSTDYNAVYTFVRQ